MFPFNVVVAIVTDLGPLEYWKVRGVNDHTWHDPDTAPNLHRYVDSNQSGATPSLPALSS